ncbi:NAD(P)H-dependent oxidoreductase [Thermoactinomyces daqus]|uniref:NAD(P)H-dependent oxidoreductase n=1 Tax=Thermoactinomyces daqus TaxID=1329516 RepID=UPI000A3FECDB|nr:NAD(P)H-dependent oxidoreductase [Thermoactinomyces daqus]
MKIVALYGSSRESGNSEQLADYALDGLQATKIYLRHKKSFPLLTAATRPKDFTLLTMTMKASSPR